MAHGIYKIINIVNNKFYIGSAVDLKRRKTRHFSELRNGKHRNIKLQRAWDKYGEHSFIFVVVEEIEDKNTLLEAEDLWLKNHVGKDYCYNIGTKAAAPSLGKCGELSATFGRKRTPDELAAQSWLGRKHKEESKQAIRSYLIGKPKPAHVRAKISATLSGEGNYWYGKKRPEHGLKVAKPVSLFTVEGVEIRFASITHLRLGYDMTATSVNRALKSGKPFSKGPHKGVVIKYSEPLASS